MRRYFVGRCFAIAGLMLAAGVSIASAQDAPTATPSPAQSSPPPVGARKPLKKPAPTDPIPDAPVPAPDAAPVTMPGDQDAPAPVEAAPAPTPTTPAPAGKKRSTAEANPFPEDFSKAAPKDGGDTAPPDRSQGDVPSRESQPGDAQSSDSKPSNSSTRGSGQPDSAPGAADATDSSSQQGLDKIDLYGDKDKKHKKNADPDAGLPFDPKLAAQDNKIAELYLKNGNAPGAYSRFKEAAQYDAGNADAVFGLAEAARQLNLLDEAAQSYQTYLFAFPDGPKARQAKKALAEMRIREKR